jgi:hypothetical protein
MRRLTLTLENYDDSKIVRSSILEHTDESASTISMLARSGVDFLVEEVGGDLYHLQMDDGNRYLDLPLRTKKEVEEWIHRESFEVTIKGFLESREPSIQLLLDRKGSYIKVDRGR